MKKNIVWLSVTLLTVSLFILIQQENEPKPRKESTITQTSMTEDEAIVATMGAQTAPPFTLPSLDGKSHQLADYLDKPIILNFWASWCTPCKSEAPELNQIADHYKGKVHIIGINLTDQDSVSEAKSFVKEHHLSFPILLDKDGDISASYGVVAVPTTFFLTKNGEIVDQMVGYGGEGSLALKAVSLIEGKNEKP